MKIEPFLSKQMLIIGILIMNFSSALCAEKFSTTNEEFIRSIVFRNGWLYFMSEDGEVISRDRISDICSIVFPNSHSGATDNIEIPEENNCIYPNPVQETLYIESAECPSYKIFDIDGRCLLRGDGNSINVSVLKTGTYLLQINNKSFKFIKR